jgi:hypothetical protein
MLDKIFEFLYQQWLWDINNMSQPWMYWCLLIPITAYVMFFIIKWSVLTAPIWLPINRALRGFPINLNLKEKQ